MDDTKALTVRETLDVAAHFARSGLFPKTAAEQAFVKIMAGQELGIPPFAAMTGIHVIQGKATLGAGIIAGRIKASGKYDYQVDRLDDTGCELTFLELRRGSFVLGTKPEWRKVGQSSFTEADAKQAGLLAKDNWRKFPRNLYFARAISNGQKWYCPDVTAGPVYTPEELGGDVVEAEVVDVTPKSQRQELLGSVDDVAQYEAELEEGDDGLITEQAQETAPHWIDDEAQRGNFWRAAGGMAYDRDEAHLVLGVEGVRDYPGTAGEALTKLADHRKVQAAKTFEPIEPEALL